MTAEHPAPGSRWVVGLVGDPGLPYQLARDIAPDLAEELRQHVSDRWDWRIVAIEHRFSADEQGQLALKDIVDTVVTRHGLDVVVCITDQPRRSGTQPIVADITCRDRVAITSLPALGAVRLRRRARHAVVRLVAELVADAIQSLPHGADAAVGTTQAAMLAPFARTTPGEGDIDVRFVGTGRHSRLRLLAGMVRANRPWLLVPQLSSAFAAAFAAGALVLITETVWRMAVLLGSLRLGVAAVLAVATMVSWLVVDHEMWERPSSAEDRELARLYNATTLITVAIGVVCLYAGLFVAGLMVEALLLPRSILGSALGHTAGIGEYLAVAWLLATIATVGGAVGTGFASDEAVVQAAYGYRQRERRDHESPHLTDDLG
ncbi:MAG TPA: hypothetical protein VE623_07935 [Acidimicrobiales bacterium]|nr:hypothetical protein [Acidimicrobiales bacterium]